MRVRPKSGASGLATDSGTRTADVGGPAQPGVQDARAPERQPLRPETKRPGPSLQPAALASPTSLISPRPGQPYLVSSHWEGQRFDFAIELTPELCQQLESDGLRLDLKTAELVSTEGERFRVVEVPYQERTGKPAPPWLLYHPEWDVFGLPRGKLRLGSEDGAVILHWDGALKTLEPDHEPNRPYPVSVEWRGRRYDFTVELEPSFARFLDGNYFRLDFERGELVRGEERVPLSDCGEAYRKTTGEETPPWLMQHLPYGYFGVPTGTVRISLEGDVRTTIHFEKLASDAFFGDVPGNEAPKDRTPIPPAAWNPHRVEVSPALTFEAQTPELAERARALFEETAGPSRREHERSLPALKKACDRLLDLDLDLHDIRPTSPEAASLIAAAKAECAPHDASEWSLRDARSAVAARLERHGKRVNHDVHVVVVPKGKHWSAMPHLLHDRNLETHQSSTALAANVIYRSERFVFLPEEDLLSENPWQSKHEVRHVIEDVYLPEASVQLIDDAFAASVQHQGPFARPYGSQRGEFFTTFGEPEGLGHAGS